ncbi:MAG TPA: hypothetical protein VFX35_11055 [Solirubrobacterales bacterium]|nr:hypothetical protein [Solirubrobacterales bacterium]
MAGDSLSFSFCFGASDVNRLRSWRKKAPELGCGSVAQDRAFATRKHRGHPPPSRRDTPNADDIDAPEDLVQLPSLQAAHDPPSSHPKLQQLPPAHHRMLPPRQVGHHPVRD